MADRSEELPLRLAEYIDSHRFGKYRGVVERVGTGDELGLLTAVVPEVLGEEPTGWARPAVPFAGARHGFVTLPEAGDGVWIEFEAGDVAKPIWTGFWWADGEMPEGAGERTRVLATSNGHRLVLDEDDDELRIEHGKGPSIVLTANAVTIKVGGTKVVVSASGVSVNDGALDVT